MSRHKDFWDKEYESKEHFALSDNPSEDLLKFTRWLGRRKIEFPLHPLVLDLGSGNGRNSLFLEESFGARGVGFDISAEATEKANAKTSGNFTFETRSIAEPLSLENESVDIALDLMTSHYLREAERLALRSELVRVLKPGGWLLFKTLFKDGDRNAERMLREYPAGENNSYIHPEIGVYEHVWTEDELYEFFRPYFEIHKVEKSHLHILKGKAFKRRYIVAYLEKK